MIHRQNYLDVRAYLHHIDRVRQNDPQTVSRYRTALRQLLEWADATPFTKARHIDPTFPAYIAAVAKKGQGQGMTLAPATIHKTLAVARQYFDFARKEWRLRYKRISVSWIELLQPPRHARMDSRLPVHEFWTLEDVRKVASVSTATLREERGKVAVVMLFLSGMRADALASLPISCVDLANSAIKQLPELGVRTKNRKAAITYLLQIPDLLQVLHRWQSLHLSFRLPPSVLWYATLTRDGMTLTPTTTAFEGRHTVIARDIKTICEKANVPYLSPHKLRHGHIVYARNLAQNMIQLKAVSQNVMHETIVITDQVYANLTGNNVGSIITSLQQQLPSPAGRRAGDEGDNALLIQQLTALLHQLESTK